MKGIESDVECLLHDRNLSSTEKIIFELARRRVQRQLCLQDAS